MSELETQMVSNEKKLTQTVKEKKVTQMVEIDSKVSKNNVSVSVKEGSTLTQSIMDSNRSDKDNKGNSIKFKFKSDESHRDYKGRNVESHKDYKGRNEKSVEFISVEFKSNESHRDYKGRIAESHKDYKGRNVEYKSIELEKVSSDEL